MLGLVRHLSARRREPATRGAIVLGLAPAGAGQPRWWTSDGSFVPLRFLPRLAELAASVAGAGTELGGRPHRGRGYSPGYPARLRGHPAITIGALDSAGLAPRSHLPSDTATHLDAATADGLLTLALTLVDAIDAELPTDRDAAPPSRASARQADRPSGPDRAPGPVQ